jgi:hypothetical protein
MSSLPAEGYQLKDISASRSSTPADRAATAALAAVPMLDTSCAKLIESATSGRCASSYLGSSVRLGPDQLPEVCEGHTSRSS